jgi:hypothetical protein
MVIFMFFFCIPVHSESLVIGIRNDVYDPGMLKAAERIKQAAQASGNAIQFYPSPAKRSLKLASIGIIDWEFYRHSIIEPLHPSLIRVDVALGKFDYDIWIDAENNCMKDWEALAQLKPVGTRGVVFFDTRVYPLSKVGYEEVNTMIQVMELLKRGRADYTVHNHSVIEEYSKKTGIKLKRCLGESLFSMNFYLYLHESKRHLVTDLEQALREVKKRSKKTIAI